MAEAVCVDPKQVHLIWPQVSHWIRAAIERGDLGTFDSVESDVLSGQAFLWLAWNEPDIEAAVVTQLVKTERTKSCVIVACGGKSAPNWSGLISQIESYAKAEGCDAVRIFGRSGWARVYPDYQVARVVLEKRL